MTEEIVDLKSEFENRNHTMWTIEREKNIETKINGTSGNWKQTVLKDLMCIPWESQKGTLYSIFKKSFYKKGKDDQIHPNLAKGLNLHIQKAQWPSKKKKIINSKIHGQTILLTQLKTRGKEKVMNTSKEKITHA